MKKQIVTLTLFDELGRRKYLNQKERKLFLEALSKQKIETKLFCMLLYWTGARIKEGHNTTINNIDFDEEVVVIESLKKRRRNVFRKIPLPSAYCASLLEFIKKNNLQTSIWSKSVRSYSRHIKKVMQDAEIIGPQASAKGLRHSYAVHCITCKIPLTLVQKWMGHASINTTAIYLDIVGPEEREFAQRIWGDP